MGTVRIIAVNMSRWIACGGDGGVSKSGTASEGMMNEQIEPLFLNRNSLRPQRAKA